MLLQIFISNTYINVKFQNSKVQFLTYIEVHILARLQRKINVYKFFEAKNLVQKKFTQYISSTILCTENLEQQVTLFSPSQRKKFFYYKTTFVIIRHESSAIFYNNEIVYSYQNIFFNIVIVCVINQVNLQRIFIPV